MSRGAAPDTVRVLEVLDLALQGAEANDRPDLIRRLSLARLGVVRDGLDEPWKLDKCPSVGATAVARRCGHWIPSRPIYARGAPCSRIRRTPPGCE